MVTYEMLFSSSLTNPKQITIQRNKLIMANQSGAVDRFMSGRIGRALSNFFIGGSIKLIGAVINNNSNQLQFGLYVASPAQTKLTKASPGFPLLSRSH
jgi:hypothetical protein